MKHIKIILIIFLGISLSCEKEVNPELIEDTIFEGKNNRIENPKEYSSVHEDLKTPFFIEDFEDNVNNWSVGFHNDYTLLIKNGVYSITNKTTDLTYFITRELDIDTSKNFEIETYIDIYEGIDNNGGGLVFGCKFNPIESNYFIFKESEENQIGIYQNNTFYDFTYWSGVYTYTGNKLTVRKINNLYYFFINEYFIDCFANVFYGNNIGFIISPNTNIEVAYLYVKYIR